MDVKIVIIGQGVEAIKTAMQSTDVVILVESSPLHEEPLPFVVGKLREFKEPIIDTEKKWYDRYTKKRRVKW